MKIDDALQKAVALNNEKAENKSSAKANETKSPAAAGESVTLSPLASQLQSLEAAVASDNVYDADKVSAIKSAISSGQFRVDSEKVADGLINTVKDLLTTPR
ncbi:flagellar biosynthesis anti-sigma factor FlgM [Methylobacillus caricis]|uniref:flagellar biosynthesis anti-sigma factor FlgM n=1 Tax=Methylobacillus caricis TaxID=1971611 RepID=UPI001CFF5F26|nr:flagellar biosynthesis anti-sigma factor FlgM [Methylobacillus caricis]MCB5187983.1 flagellar biosynthesis anti-sigma factor FlgM [Methylobacillus caricis]